MDTCTLVVVVNMSFSRIFMYFLHILQAIPDLQKLQSTIRGKKCEVHVTSIMEEDQLEEKMADMSLASKVGGVHVLVHTHPVVPLYVLYIYVLSSCTPGENRKGYVIENEHAILAV